MAFVRAEKTAQGIGDTSPAYDTTTNGVKFIVAYIGSDNGGPTPSISDSPGNTYTYLTTYGTGNPPWNRGRLAWCRNPTTSTTHTFTSTGLNESMVVLMFNDTMAASPFDVENGNKASAGTSISTGSVTPSQANCLVVSGIGFAFGMTPTIDSGFTKPATNGQADFQSGVNYGSAAAYLYPGSTAALNPAWAITNVEGIATSIAVFKIQAAGGAPPLRRSTMRPQFYPRRKVA